MSEWPIRAFLRENPPEWWVVLKHRPAVNVTVPPPKIQPGTRFTFNRVPLEEPPIRKFDAVRLVKTAQDKWEVENA